LPLLNTRNEQLGSALELIKSREKAALELQKQIKTAQERFDATKLKTEKLSNEYADLDKRLAKNKGDLGHISANVQQQEKQLQAIVDLLQTPFQNLENWQVYFQDSLAELKEKVQKFQQTEHALSSATTALVEINHNEKLAAQALEQCLLNYRNKQAETRRKTEEKQTLSTERDALLPSSGSGIKLSADSYEQSINQKVLTARAAHQQASTLASPSITPTPPAGPITLRAADLPEKIATL
jgi:exonuclease SbcC